MNNLKVASYSNSLRKLLGLPSHKRANGMFVNLNIHFLGELLRKYVYTYLLQDTSVCTDSDSDS